MSFTRKQGARELLDEIYKEQQAECEKIKREVQRLTEKQHVIENELISIRRVKGLIDTYREPTVYDQT